jgi:hypothetical protein
LLPSKKLPEEPPKMKYFQEGMEGAKMPLIFHLEISWLTSGSFQV